MFQRTTPARLTLIVLALILGILLGLAFLPSGDLSGAALSDGCDSTNGTSAADCLALEQLQESPGKAQFRIQPTYPLLVILVAVTLIILTLAALSALLKRT